MIRINLLPGAPRKQARASGGSGAPPTGWIVGYAAAALITVTALWLVYADLSRELREQNAQNAQVEADIAEIERSSANIDEVRAALEESRELEAVVLDLQRARFGPTRVLVEVAHILSEGGGPSIDPRRLEELRRDNPLAGFNPSWDFHRLWMTSFVEEDRHVEIEGTGRTNDDVAEFLRRLSLSDLFENVHLTRTEAATDAATRLEFIHFELEATVRY
jgi:type IV pilus assembly protein PilN